MSSDRPNSPDFVAFREQADALRAEVDRGKNAETRLTRALATETEKGAAGEERFRLLVESVRDYAIFMLDPSGVVATWNAGAARIKGYAADEIIGRHFSVFYPDDDVRAGKCELELEVAARDDRFEDEGFRVRKDGSSFWAHVVIGAVRDERGALIGFSKVTGDRTDRRRAEQEATARLAAEQANRAKDEFLAMLGHELRNPLAPIVSALQLMRLRGDTGSSMEQAVIERQVHHMTRLVDDLLDISRITQGKVELDLRRVDLRAIIARSVEVARPLLEQRRHHLQVHLPPHDIVVEGDEGRLLQVFTNLITNAAKYTAPGGHIEVVARRDGAEAVVDVRDDGIGIEPALMPRIFGLFVQGNQSSERAVGGLGLGLALVSTLVRLHHGKVEASSAGGGRGSTFTVHLARLDLPVDAPRPKAGRIGFEPTARPRRILLVDDNEDALTLLASVLSTVGHDVQSASDALTAIELAPAFKPEVAILDIGLPVMDGYELAARLRTALDGAVPRLFALTGYGQKNDIQRSEQAGFDRHFVKPVNTRLLLESIAQGD